MKTFLNKKVTIMEKQEVSYGELILSVAKSMSQNEGYDYESLKKIGRIDKVVNSKNNKKLELEDSDYDFLKSKLDKMKWGVYDIAFVEFTDYINSGGEK